MSKLSYRRSLTAIVFTLAASCLLFFVAARHAEAEILIEDAAGRTVRLQSPAKRIVLNESLLLLSLALIDRDPVERIAGWASPQRIDQGIYDAFRQKFPSIDQVPTVGALQPGQASAETIIGVKPDLFVVNQWQAGWEDTTRLLDAAGIPVIFLDGPNNDERNVVEATTFSIDVLGKAIGREAQAAEYTQFVRDHYAVITRSLENAVARTTVLVDGFANSACCSSPGRNNRMTQNITLAGGVSIGADAIPGYEGKLNPEYVLNADPKVYIATGTPKANSETALIVGGGISEDVARASLGKVVSETVRRDLTAVREKRAYGISHQASISALNILIVECFAKWLHPDRFSEINPNQTLAEINQRFLAVPLNGTFWIDLGH